MNDNDRRAPLILTAAMETNRIEEVQAVTERAELDLARFRAEGRAMEERRAAAQADSLRHERLIAAGLIMVVVGFWGLVYLSGGWRSVAGAVSIILIAGTCLAIAHWLAQSWERIVDVLSGR